MTPCLRLGAMGLTVVLSLAPNGLFAGQSAVGQPARQKVLSSDTLVIAHRGHSSVYPENTLPAFEAAIRANADFIELDYYHSKDGVPVVFHDKTLDRTTNASALWNEKKIPVKAKTFDQLRMLDAGSWKSARFADTHIPTLDEALDCIQAGSMTLVERKAGDAATCVQLLREKKLIDTVAVQAFDWKYLKQCHQLEPTLTLGALGSKELTPARLDEIEEAGATFIGWNHKHLTKAAADAAHLRGLKVWVYTVNNQSDAERVLAFGVDGIITDVPDQMRLWVNAARPARRAAFVD